jgi:hypothetical protein
MVYSNNTVSESRKIAEQSGSVEYYTELIAFNDVDNEVQILGPAYFTPNVSLLDEPVPDIGIPTLEPVRTGM